MVYSAVYDALSDFVLGIRATFGGNLGRIRTRKVPPGAPSLEIRSYDDRDDDVFYACASPFCTFVFSLQMTYLSFFPMVVIVK
jgi:hypothetical protein